VKRESRYKDEIKRLVAELGIQTTRFNHMSDLAENRRSEIVTLEERLQMSHQAFLEKEA